MRGWRPLVRGEIEFSPFVVEGFDGEVGSWVDTNVHFLACMPESGLVRLRLASFVEAHTLRQVALLHGYYSHL